MEIKSYFKTRPQLLLPKDRVSADPLHVPDPTLSALDQATFPLNNGYAHGLKSICANRNPIPISLGASNLHFAISLDETELWVSDSSVGTHWRRLVDGLPTAVRCGDAIFSEIGELFLSTYGRSVWQLL
jgi:hypothetical protein